MSSDAGDKTQLLPGFPIRKSSNHSLVIDYPRLIADSYVLHRFLVPRHPPCALKNLTQQRSDARVHCAVLKTPPHNPPHQPQQADTRRKGTTKQAPTVNTADTRKPNSAPHATTRTRRQAIHTQPRAVHTHQQHTSSHITDVPPTSKHPTPHTGMKDAPLRVAP